MSSSPGVSLFYPSHWMKNTAQWGISLGKEAGAGIIATELYPLGLLTNIPTLPVRHRDRFSNTAVLFLHGVFHNRSAFTYMKNRLAWEGVAQFYDFNLFSTIFPIPKLAARVAKTVEKIKTKGKAERIVIVAHSMGGIIARYYLQKLQRDGEITTLVTMGTAHQGTYLSRLSPLPYLKELAPGSRVLDAINSCPPPQTTKAVNLYGSHDWILQPKKVAMWEGIENHELTGIGHLGILFSRRAAKKIIHHLDPLPETGLSNPIGP